MISVLDATQYDEQRTSYVDAHSTSSIIQFQGLRPDWIQGFVKDFAVLRADLERCGDIAPLYKPLMQVGCMRTVCQLRAGASYAD